ncbi:MAG: 6-phosphofructokinase [Saprospiraceae bacterium]|nr:6-phosphofructokinase [Saprospiraceae bacterium]
MTNNIKRIAVFTSGGDAPGMNTAIRAVARTAIYHDLHVYGIYGGYDGMIRGDISRLELRDVGNIMQRGGTILKTARSKEFMTVEGRMKAAESLKAHDIDACVAIGGNGTFTGALVFSEEHNIPFVGLPGTIDNDLYGTDYTIGFDTAINTAMEAVDKIRDTADSHNRLFFIEVMGRHSGYIALHTAIGTGATNVFLPEVPNSIETLIGELRFAAKRHKLFNLVIVAEGNEGGNATELAAIVKEKAPEFDTKVSVIGHLQRGGSPTCSDRVLASRLGYASVEALIKGKKNVAIGIVNDHLTYTPFEDAIHKVKDLNKDLINMAQILAT